MNSVFTVILFIVAIFIFLLIIFLVIRGIMLWYWRINEAVDALINISNSQINISNSLEKISNSLKSSVENNADNGIELGKTIEQLEKESLEK